MPNIIFFIANDMYPERFNYLPEGAGNNLTPNLDSDHGKHLKHLEMLPGGAGAEYAIHSKKPGFFDAERGKFDI